jgi:hypothetical protein
MKRYWDPSLPSAEVKPTQISKVRDRLIFTDCIGEHRSAAGAYGRDHGSAFDTLSHGDRTIGLTVGPLMGKADWQVDCSWHYDLERSELYRERQRGIHGAWPAPCSSSVMHDDLQARTGLGAFLIGLISDTPQLGATSGFFILAGMLDFDLFRVNPSSIHKQDSSYTIPRQGGG